MMEARLIFMALVCLCIAQMALAEDQIHAFKNPAAEQQYVKILKGIRCTICQNQSLFESNAKIAVDLRKHIYEMFSAGWSQQQIYAYLRQRYGDHILYMPPFGINTAVLWFAPGILLLAAAFAGRRYMRINRNAESNYAC